MHNLLFQVVIPFILSAAIVTLITIIAEHYGTKVGGIIGTLPSTIVIAFFFIALNRGVYFASRSVAVVPAEMGINVVFLFFLSILLYRSTYLAIVISLTVWVFLSALLFILGMENIFISLAIYIIALVPTFMVLERVKQVSSTDSVEIHYTPMKIVFRGLLAGAIVAIAVSLSNIGAAISGIFSVFPVIFLSTMLISIREHGPDFAGGIAKSMIFGTPSILSYVTAVYFLYPTYGPFFGTIYAFCASIVTTVILLKLRVKMK